MPSETTAVAHGKDVDVHRHTIEAVFGGSLAGSLVAAGAAALAIIGLAGMFPQMLVSIATIGIGAAFLFEGGAIVSRLRDLLHEVTEGRVQVAELGAGVTGETLAGFAGVALGILGTLGVIPEILIAVAAIVFGAALVMGAGSNMRINEMSVVYRQEHPMAQRIAREAVRGTTGLQILAGLGAITLGILALVGIASLVLSMAAMLSISGAFLLTDTAVASRMWTVLGPRH